MKKLFISLMVLFAFVTHNQAKEWLFSDPQWYPGTQIMNPLIIDGLLVLGDTTMDIAVNNDFTPKAYLGTDNVAGTFTQRLQLNGAASFLPDFPTVPLARAVSFPVMGNGTISIYCLSSSSTETRKLIVSNGEEQLAVVTAQPSNYKDGEGIEVPLYQYQYTGEGDAIFLYSAYGGVDLYAIEATNFVDSLFPPNDMVDFNVEVPSGTNECWIAGNFNGWDPTATQLFPVDDTHFSISLPLAHMSNIEYKYLSGPGWAYVEKDADGQEIANRIYAGGTDVVVNWLSVYNPSTAINKNITFMVTVPSQVETLRVVGSHNNWNPGDSAIVMDLIDTYPHGKLFSKTLFVNDVENMEYKFVAGSDWEFVQANDPNYANVDPTKDTIRHIVYGFYAYENSAAMPRVWNFSKEPFGEARTFAENTDMWDLKVAASADRTIVVDANQKSYDQIQFDYRLKLGGSAVMDPEHPNTPQIRALAFNVAGNSQIAVSCLSSSSTADRQLVISNGVDELGTIPAPGVYAEGNSNIPLSVFNYEGPATTLFLYSKDSGVNIYYLAVSNYNPPSLTYTVDVPVETEEVWIVGDFSNWISGAQKMERVDDNTFTATVWGATVDHGYKYLSGKDWEYVETDADGGDIVDRTYQPLDTVLRWLQLYVPYVPVNKNVTFEVKVPFAVQEVRLMGTFSGWDPANDNNLMTYVGDVENAKLFQKTVWVEDMINMQYKFTAGNHWNYVQTQDNDFVCYDTNQDTVRHVVFGFYEYQNTTEKPRDWNMSKEPFADIYDIDSYHNKWWLLMMGSSENVMRLEQDSKYFQQNYFTHRLRTNGAAKMDTANPAKPVSGAVAFEVEGNAQIAVACLAADFNEVRNLVISDGKEVLGGFMAVGNFNNGQSTVPMQVFNYEGPATPIYLYSDNGGIDIYYIGVTNHRDSVPYEEPKMTYTVQVPMETEQVYIAGDFNNWQPHWMERVDSVTFQTTIWGATPQHQYKYLNGTDWKYEEVHSDASAVANRNYNQLDVVEAWAELLIQENVKIYYEDINTIVGEVIQLTLKSTSNQPRDVISYEFTFNFDHEMLEYNGYSVDNTLSDVGTIIVNNTTESGKLYISYMSSEPFSNVGDLLHLNFQVINTHGWDWTECWVDNFYFDDREVWNYEPGRIWIHSYTAGDVDGNERIQAYDAALTLQYSVGKDPLPQLDPLPWEAWRVKAADVDGVDGVTANDAAMILQYSAHVIYSFPVDDTPEAGMAIKANNTADVSISEENEMLVFRSSGNLIGLNVFLQNNQDVLGAPQFSSNVDLSAVNMEDGQYAIGLVALEAPAEGAEIMRIPILKGSETDLLFHLIVNADEKIVNSRITTGINDVSTTAVNLRPNPVVDQLYISNLTVGSRLVVYDISGRALIMQEVQSDREQLDVSQLLGGVYTIVISNNEKQLISKFIKK